MSQKEIDHAIRMTFRNPPILASEDRAQYEDLKLRGEVEYRDRSVEVLPDTSDEFRQSIRIMISDIAGSTPLARVACVG